MNQFKRLGLTEPILRVIGEKGFDEPTEIQRRSVPLVTEGKDVIGGSATGSGKTLAFAAGIIKFCERGKGIQSLILTPTRELAEQIRKALIEFSKYKPLEIISVYGGVAINPQIEGLKSADVVVGTPGRVLDHIGRNTVNFRNVRILVLDEADRMLDMGFIDDVERIIRQCPRERQTLLFSATIPPDVAELAKRYMRDPIKISAVTYVDPRKLRQVYYDVPDNIRFSLLVHLLKNEKSGLVMVFCNTRSNVDFVANNLKANGVDAEAIHGGLTQDRRSRIMDKFNGGDLCVLVCTDVAARGLDIEGVSHVYNYDIPDESKQYIHRIGRTARAGKNGKAISILAQKDHDNFRRVIRDHGIDAERGEAPYVERVEIKWKQAPGRRFGSERGGFRRDRRRDSKPSYHRRPRRR